MNKLHTREEYEAAAAAASSPQAIKRAIAAAQSYKAEYGPKEWFNRRDGHPEACSGQVITKQYGVLDYTYSIVVHDPDGYCCFNAALNAWIAAATAWGN